MEPSSCHVSLPECHTLLDWILFLDPRYAEEGCNGDNWDVSLRSVLFARSEPHPPTIPSPSHQADYIPSGMGPVPFTYSAEAFPLHIREIGMSFATATTWCFNFILSFTWPPLVSAFKSQGAFDWYAAWCIIGWIGVLLFLPETKALTLEELDQVFNVPTWKHSSYQLKKAGWAFKRYVLRKNIEPLPPFWIGQEKLEES